MSRAFIVGRGEVGGRIGSALAQAGWGVAWVTRSAGWSDALDPGDPAPRIVAVREEDLASVLERFGDALAERLVLLQNGFLEAVHGELQALDRGLIYFTSKKEFFRVLCPSPFFGRSAEALATALSRGGIPAEALPDRAAFLREMILKGIWNVVVGLPLAVHGVDLATYLRDYRAELDALADESARAASAEYGVEVTGPDAVQKILDTTADLGWVTGGAKALPWRNAAIATFGRRHGIPTPINDRLLASE